eukprot:m.66805 g.66805  ORF g.66805 m.66805 type:complete len:651 (+) comp11839_c0_seq3:243-2195(+)
MGKRSVLLLLVVVIHQSKAVDNGIGLTPPMGWRHWKAFYGDINQNIMQTIMDEMSTKRDVDGVPTSLKDLGYLYVGLDDHWQNCTRLCPNGTVIPSWLLENGDYGHCDNKWHNGTNDTGSIVYPWYTEEGKPIVDTHRFPDLGGMVSYAHAKGLRAGWYFGNYQCAAGMANHNPAWNLTKLAIGSVNAIKEYGFDSVKLDSGFPVGQNLTLWADLLNATGRPVMIENCHQGADAPGLVHDGGEDHNCTGLTPTSDCPFNFWRTTGDPEPGWGTIMRELNTLRKNVNPNYPSGIRPGAPTYNGNPPRSRPGGWAYPGTMVVGDGSMTEDENKVHFGGWCIVSSPLILAFNLSDPVRRALVWETITNKEAITVNQAWEGHPGSQIMDSLGSNKAVEVWTKPIGGNRTAAFFLNTADASIEAPQSGGLSMVACDPKDNTQLWTFSSGVSPGSAKPTNIQSAVSGSPHCWEITACKTGPEAGVGTNYGCKPLPADPTKCSSNLCSCNGLWALNNNGTIQSLMDGNCAQVENNLINVSPCTGKANQQFQTTAMGNNAFQIKQGSLCVSNGPSQSASNATVTVQLKDLNLGFDGPVRVRDVWNKKDLPEETTQFSTKVNYHGSQFIIFMPKDSEWPLPFQLPAWINKTTPKPPSHF